MSILCSSGLRQSLHQIPILCLSRSYGDFAHDTYPVRQQATVVHSFVFNLLRCSVRQNSTNLFDLCSDSASQDFCNSSEGCSYFLHQENFSFFNSCCQHFLTADFGNSFSTCLYVLGQGILLVFVNVSPLDLQHSVSLSSKRPHIARQRVVLCSALFLTSLCKTSSLPMKRISSATGSAFSHHNRRR